MIYIGDTLVKKIFLGDTQIPSAYLGDTLVSAVVTAVPTFASALTYNGQDQTATFNNFDTDALTVSGNTGRAAGTYTAIFSLNTGYVWPDFTFEDKAVTWSIGQKKMAVPAPASTQTYSGSAITAVFNNYDTTAMSVRGNTATNAGTYTAVFTLANVNYCWSDNSVEDKNVSWVIARQKITATPSQSGTLTYNTSSQTPAWSNYEVAKLDIGGDTSGTNAGAYNATFTPTANYCWNDNSITAKTVSWSIAKAAGYISLSKSDFTLDDLSTTFTASADGGEGTVTMSQSSTTYCSASLSNGTVTVSAKLNGGTNALTFSSAATTNYTSASATLTVTVAVPVTYTGSNITFSGSTTGDWMMTVKASTTLKFTKLVGPIDVFLVGGGGGGGRSGHTDGAGGGGGGGGGGGYTTTATNVAVSLNTNYTISVGAGGSARVQGGTSTAFSKSATGGCGGNSWTNWFPNGGNGGSGGGAGGSGTENQGGAGGSNGGNGGANAKFGTTGGIGQGTTTRAFGASSGTAYSGGGGGGTAHGNVTASAGGVYGGGKGGKGDTTANKTSPASGTANSGGGGGGGGAYLTTNSNTYEDGASGGSGIIIIRNHRA